jgi:hypothetical protein
MLHPRNFTKHVGDSITVRSGVRRGTLESKYEIKFFKDRYEPYGNISREEDEYTMTIGAVKLSDAGTYQAQVVVDDSYHVPDIQRITLVVYDAPKIEWSPESAVVNEGDSSVSFSCKATGGPNLIVSWLRDGKNITERHPPHYRFETVDNVSTITIRTPSYNESGQLKCVATVKVGNTKFQENSSAAYLTVLESEFYLETVVTEHKQLQLTESGPDTQADTHAQRHEQRHSPGVSAGASQNPRQIPASGFLCAGCSSSGLRRECYGARHSGIGLYCQSGRANRH